MPSISFSGYPPPVDPSGIRYNSGGKIYNEDGSLYSPPTKFDTTIGKSQKDWSEVDLRGFSEKTLKELEYTIELDSSIERSESLGELKEEIKNDEFFVKGFTLIANNIGHYSFWHNEFYLDGFWKCLYEEVKLSDVYKRSVIKHEAITNHYNMRTGWNEIQNWTGTLNTVRNSDILRINLSTFEDKCIEYKRKYVKIMKTKVVLNKTIVN
tara:strand:- start:1449 stop:2078 length:630 start_codon:yes stop_codon:yes gene_type:complete